MTFWHFWEQGFQAFMVLIGVCLVWLRFIEPLFQNRSLSVIVMLIVAFALTIGVFVNGVKGIQKKVQAAQAQINATLAQGEEVE